MGCVHRSAFDIAGAVIAATTSSANFLEKKKKKRAREQKPRPVKVSFWIRKSPAHHVYSGPPQQMEGSRYRETNTCDPCCRFLLFNRFHWCLVPRQSPIWNCLNLFRRPDRKWRESRCERHDSRSQNSSVWNAGARHSSAQWPLGNRPN